MATINVTVGPWADRSVECYGQTLYFRPGSHAERQGAAPVEAEVKVIPRPFTENEPPSCEKPDGRVWTNNEKAIGFGCSDDDGDVVTFSVVKRPQHGRIASFTTAPSLYGSNGGQLT